MSVCRFLTLPAVVLWLCIGCGPDTPSFAPLPVDAGRECGGGDEDGGEGTSCESGQVCLAGRCYDACDSDQQCAPRESCLDGVCAIAERGDMGVDMGTDMGPCTGVMCEAGQVCHGASGACVQCGSEDDCAAAAPICDIAFGSCVPFQPGLLCAPCNVSGDCPNAGDVCTDRSTERVCLAPCSDGGVCPGGFRCNGDMLCEPNIGSCTQLRLAIGGVTCAVDTDCVPLGSAAAPGTCDPATMKCLAVCSEGFSCPGGFSCDDPTDGFCRPAL